MARAYQGYINLTVWSVKIQEEWDWLEQEKKDQEAEQAREKEKKKSEKAKGRSPAEEPEAGPSNKKVHDYNFRVPRLY